MMSIEKALFLWFSALYSEVSVINGPILKKANKFVVDLGFAYFQA